MILKKNKRQIIINKAFRARSKQGKLKSESWGWKSTTGIREIKKKWKVVVEEKKNHIENISLIGRKSKNWRLKIYE